MRQNKYIFLIVMIAFMMLFMGCVETIRLDKFVLESEISDGYMTGNAAELTMRLTNNWKTITVQTGSIGPFSYSVYRNDELIETLEFSVMQNIRLYKSKAFETKNAIDTSAAGKYRIEIYVHFRYDDTEYSFCRQVIEFEKTKE